MAGNRKQRKATELRKRRQAAARHVAALRLEAVNFEHVTEKTAARMSREALERLVKHGKRRKGITGLPRGLHYALIAAELNRA